ncbi:helix-turn-helix domain-containing protein [Flavobacterium columnare]|uniref:helix-turn-helix domain-containing protein n=1 Tax=Flavobacterium columnare TaxID=996 RepID=UPI002989E33C|nr:helix-turn-helix domain-containing protein [Flavobacterium columnare]MCH4829759.1 helix-turn-helix domain-containing protein [Flavobacterium columnare]
MVTFGKRLREARDSKGLSQQDLAKLIGSVHTVIGRYERDEMKPSIDVVKKLADEIRYNRWLLNWRSQRSSVLKDPTMLKRFQEIDELTEKDKECVFSLLDAYLAKSKLQAFLK